MEGRLSQQNSLIATRELPIRKLHLQKRKRGFHETIGLAARSNRSPSPGDGWTSPPKSQVTVAADGGAAASTKKPRGRGRPPKKQTKTTKGKEKRQVFQNEGTSQGPPPPKKRRGRQPKATQRPPLSSSTPSSDIDLVGGTRGRARTPARARGTQTMRNYIATPATTAANQTDSSAAEEGETTENLEGREGELAMLEKMFEYVWSTYYASIDTISSDQMESALKIFFERAY